MSSSFTLDDNDVLEDTATAAEDLRAAGCPQPVITAVRALTKQPGEPLEQATTRAVADPIARAIKRTDIADNSNPERLAVLDHPTSPVTGTADGH
jgi:TusA-related sulfurtransferase